MAANSATTAPEAFGSSLPPGPERTNLELTRRYLAAIESGVNADGSANNAHEFYSPDVIQVEYPNQFVPLGATRTLAELSAAAERGRKVIRSQRYDVLTAMAHGDRVALEVLWAGTLAIPVGKLAAGDEMLAHFGVFITFRDGLIVRQHNYDCFDPY